MASGQSSIPPIGNGPPPPPLPPHFGKSKGPAKLMIGQLKPKEMRKTGQKDEASGTATNGVPRLKPKDDLMSELNSKLRKLNPQPGVPPAAPTSPTSSTDLNSSATEQRESPSVALKTWLKPASTSLLSNEVPSSNGVNSTDSPKEHKKLSRQPSTPSTVEPVEETNSQVVCTKADLDRLRQDIFVGFAQFKQEILNALRGDA